MSEPLDAGDDDGVPVDLVELHEVLEWQAGGGVRPGWNRIVNDTGRDEPLTPRGTDGDPVP